MASPNNEPDGSESGNYDEHASDHEEPGFGRDGDETESDGHASSCNDDDDPFANPTETDISQFASFTPTPTVQGAEIATNTAGEPETSGRKSNKRSPNTADLSQGSDTSKRTSHRKPYLKIRKTQKFNNPSEEHAERLRLLQRIFPRKGPAGSHKIRIVCRGRKCPRQFFANDWPEARRHYLKTDRAGNSWHPDTPFDKNEFKYMSVPNAEKRAARIKSGGEPDHESESESAVSEQDYRGFNSVPNRPGTDAKKVGKRTRSYKGKEKADNRSGKGPATRKGSTKGGKQPERSGDEDAIGEQNPTSKDCSERCALLHQALQKAAMEVFRLRDQIERDRQDRRDELHRLAHEAAAFAQDPELAPSPLSYERVVDMIHNVASRGNDAQSWQHVWEGLVVPMMIADFQNLPEMPQQTPGLFIFRTPEPLRFSTSVDFNANDATINPSESISSIDPTLQYPGVSRQQAATPPTARQHGLSNEEAQRRIEYVQANTRRQDEELTREQAVEVLDGTEWNGYEAVDLINISREPPRER